MASWGIESYENDGTYDCLKSHPDQMTEHQLNVSIQRAVAHYYRKTEPDESKETPVVGTVVFCVDKRGCKVKNKSHLELALKIAKKWVGSKDYLSNWKIPMQRKVRLGIEIKIMEGALNGYNKKRSRLF